MRRTIATATTVMALVLMGLPLMAGADHGTLTAQGNCPEAGKVEDGAVDQNLVLAAGMHVCIKGGSADATLITADGVKTLKQLLNNGHDVSHYTIIQNATTTTVEDDTTTTVEDDTTTTVGNDTTTTVGNDTTTTIGGGGAIITFPPTTIPGSNPLPSPAIPDIPRSPASAPSAAPPPLTSLPFTGLNAPMAAGLGTLLALLGSLLVRRGDDE